MWYRRQYAVVWSPANYRYLRESTAQPDIYHYLGTTNIRLHVPVCHGCARLTVTRLGSKMHRNAKLKGLEVGALYGCTVEDVVLQALHVLGMSERMAGTSRRR
jgi:hypothetical protein